VTLLASYSARTPHRPTMCLCDATPRHDPSGTSGIRRRYEADLIRRFKRLRALIYEAVVKNDVLGQGVSAQMFQKSFGRDAAMIRDAVPGRQPGMSPRSNIDNPYRGRYQFSSSADKIDGFMAWLKQMQAEGILEIQIGTPLTQAAGTAWQNVYIESAYRKGVADAAGRLRESGARVEGSWVTAAFDRPIHADRVALAYSRAFSDLAGVTDAMDAQISRVLAQGLSEGRGPMYIARQMVNRVDKIGIARARIIARTEVIRAHAEATLNSYTEAKVEGVNVMAEFSTSLDNAVCPECAALEGKEYTMEQARGLIPVHPRCRCAYLPVVRAPENLALQ